GLLRAFTAVLIPWPSLGVGGGSLTSFLPSLLFCYSLHAYRTGFSLLDFRWALRSKSNRLLIF
ncbi:MAG: hypothetical protein ACRCUB_14610, partial [Plesiomonas shigelloides]